MKTKSEGDVHESTTWQRAQRRLQTLAVGQLDDWTMVLQPPGLEEEGSMGGEEKVEKEAGHPGWDNSRWLPKPVNAFNLILRGKP